MREKIQNVKKKIETATSETTEGKKKFERLDAEPKSIQEQYNQMEQRIIEDEAAIKKLDDETGKSKIEFQVTKKRVQRLKENIKKAIECLDSRDNSISRIIYSWVSAS